VEALSFPIDMSAKGLTNSIGMKLMAIPAGEFTMGSPDAEPNRDREEKQHQVVITHPFYLGAYLVTQAQYQSVMGYNPSCFSAKVVGGDTSLFPVEQVSWQDAQDFCAKLAELAEEKRAGRVYRLPTEAEWEYACRAGTMTPYCFGQSLSTDQANFDNVLRRTTKVGSYPANPFGLCDMHGNLLQWCSDWDEYTYYRRSPRTDPQGPSSGKLRVDRGGSWNGDAKGCRAATRGGHAPDHRLNYVGFRVVCTIKAPQ
jgi:formylglycine-generating enzyme required for sulfatase activity